MDKCGGYSDEVVCGAKELEFARKMKDALQQARNDVDPGEITGLTYRVQVTDVMNIVMKVCTRNSGYFLLMIVKGRGEPELVAHKKTSQIDTEF